MKKLFLGVFLGVALMYGSGQVGNVLGYSAMQDHCQMTPFGPFCQKTLADDWRYTAAGILTYRYPAWRWFF